MVLPAEVRARPKTSDDQCETARDVRVLDGAWRSLVAHLPWVQGVGGSNPLAPIGWHFPASALRQ